MTPAERNCLNCGKSILLRAPGAKYCLDCSVEVARVKQAEWYRAYRKKQKLAKESEKAPKGINA